MIKVLTGTFDILVTSPAYPIWFETNSTKKVVLPVLLHVDYYYFAKTQNGTSNIFF